MIDQACEPWGRGTRTDPKTRAGGLRRCCLRCANGSSCPSRPSRQSKSQSSRCSSRSTRLRGCGVWLDLLATRVGKTKTKTKTNKQTNRLSKKKKLCTVAGAVLDGPLRKAISKVEKVALQGGRRRAWAEEERARSVGEIKNLLMGYHFLFFPFGNRKGSCHSKAVSTRWKK